jgi:hypothetical protein
MSRVSLTRFAQAVFLVGALAASPLAAADPAADAKDKAASAPERIRKIFEQKITIEISDQPLFLALNQLREQTKINFVLDRQTLQNMGQDAEALPVSFPKKEEKVVEVLKAIVKPYNLRYAIIGDSVFVSTDEMTMVRQLKQHISVDLEKVELAAALKQLAKETATNIVLDTKAAKEGKTIVTLQIDDVPLETAVRLLAEMAGLKTVRTGNVLYVTPRVNANDMRKTGAADVPLELDGDVRSIRRFGGPGRFGVRNVIIDEAVPVPGGLPLTEPLPPAGTGKPADPDPTPPKDEKKP